MWISIWPSEPSNLEKGMANPSSIPAWRTPWTEETGGPQSMGSQRVRYNCNTKHLILPELCLQCQFCNHMETFSILLIPNFPDKAPWDPRLCRVRLPGHWHPDQISEGDQNPPLFQTVPASDDSLQLAQQLFKQLMNQISWDPLYSGFIFTASLHHQILGSGSRGPATAALALVNECLTNGELLGLFLPV